VALYLLPRRHPVLVARQLASIGEIAAGRLTFGLLARHECLVRVRNQAHDHKAAVSAVAKVRALLTAG
jgi:alkanesulfonate monooxygenase SsuD/methylene tetrahydromethanopterin reductase-like flavin-dependent oxidoreductase (luciferase family)